ncbi:hypothetical protein FLAG1_08044 [Fusarium langsethiae]|uniref:Azaphilone pigments biosynthesis cluster protein L N-terminal domain-containing protein n=1 Tax=Fusarium langsethiae TaxID=179993 RepID=A0A0M9ESP2_FUSLA|nr:hypothetical protein FLAG1_08044 [Fusarium langsethiae]GKU22758.1 unnamed protein product [Fusarium langsethiae]
MDPGSITGIGRDKTLARLHHVLEDLDNILEVLERTVDSEASTRALLEGPVSRCNILCRDFETAMQAFGGTSKMGFRDWAKMEFMAGDINEFMDRQTSKVSREVLEEYNETIQDTMYSLNVNLQRLDEKMELLVRESKSISASNTGTDLRDERTVTEQCLRICQDARSYIDSLADREGSLKDQPLSESVADGESLFEAQLLIRRTLNESRDNLAQTIGRLQERLDSMATSGTPKSDLGYLQLEGDLKTSKQCLELCKTASEQVANQKVYTVGEMIADGDSDQVVITTLADLFNVKKASSTNRSAQWIGSLSDDTARQVSKDRYSSHFGAVAAVGAGDGISTMPSTSNTREVNSSLARRPGKTGQPVASEAVHRRPSANEIRKRAMEDGDEKEKRR